MESTKGISAKPQLIKLSGTFDIEIPERVEKIIRHLCSKIHNVEWSGILFYTVNGSWKDDDLKVICEDILPMDIGSSTYTDFTMNPDVISYMTSHDLLDCEIGLIHSHNNMASFFSGTDLDTLRNEGTDRNHFVSLIVNNAGQYVAAITRKVNIQETAFIRTRYNTFNDEEIELDFDKKTEREYDEIEYKDLNVIIEGTVENDFEELDERLTEIRKFKEAQKERELAKTDTIKGMKSIWDDDDVWYTKRWNDRKDWHDNSNYEPSFFKSNAEVELPKDFVNLTVARLLTLSMTVDMRNFNMDRWVRNMDEICDRAFNKDKNFYSYCVETFSEIIIYSSTPAEISDKYGLLPEDIGENFLIYNVLEVLDKLPASDYKNILTTHLNMMIK